MTADSRRTRTLGGLVGALACVIASATFGASPAAADAIRTAEWPLGYLDLPAAQQISTGSGVTVALLDTGVVQGRADLTGQVTAGPDYAGGIEKQGESGWGEHGTCMASIIAGHGRNGGVDGMLGAAPAAHILSVRVIRDDDAPDFGQATSDATPISDGIKYAVDHGAQVISMSLGGEESDAGDDSSAESDAIRYALAHNVVVVAAAGNGATQGNPISYPGGERGVITVAAVDDNGNHANFSTTGWDVSVAAPGVNLPCDAFDADDAYMEGSGTSQATAYVSGVVALLKAENPALTPEQIRTLLETTANAKPGGGRDDRIGFGIVNPVGALQAAKSMSGLQTVPKAGAGVASGHFGYGPTEKVTLGSSGLSGRARAEIGGAVLLAIALVVAMLLLRRPKPPLFEVDIVEFAQPQAPPMPDPRLGSDE
ncbi:S8 family serine peptidase [Actinospica sp.]|jgi:type VII secretion-associated serine protease mycosin|uniref:S8 family serine peptidase n=1 Tax=Actinospica sp. TaxID=1872142 RepID=UPI002BF64184|nr:S8 family serine peptidase [Actinospica sp.]HWG27355.1 S8 family serine peptidase [Actinospica sp.]